MTFDAAEYRKQVLTPFAKRRISEVQAAIRELDGGASLPKSIDLVEFYAMRPEWSDSEIAAHLVGVEDTIKKSTQNASLKSAAGNLMGLHERLAKNPIRTKAFWNQMFAARANRDRERLQEFGRQIEEEFVTLGVISAGQLRDVARAMGIADTVPDAELIRVVGGQVVVVADVPVITAAPQAVKNINSQLVKTSARSVIDVIFLKAERLKQFTLIDGFDAGSAAHRLVMAAVLDGIEESKYRADTDENNAATKVLTAIRAAATTDAELHNLVLGWFVDRGKQLIRENPLRVVAIDQLTRTGLNARDATRIVQSVMQGGAADGNGYSDVQSLLAEGRVKDARRTYDATFALTTGSETEEQKRALVSLEHTERKLVDLRATAEQAVRDGNVAVARRSLDEALGLCTDDEALAAAARALPPDAPIRFAVTVTPDGARVALTWEASFGSADELRYRVIRKVDIPPANNGDGTVVGLTSETTMIDGSPPIAADLYYAVAASRGAGFSPAAIAVITVVPPVADVRMSADSSSVTLRWSSHPETRAVEVFQTAPDGTRQQIEVGRQNGATARGLRLGSRYMYLITARYTRPDGSAAASQPVRVTGIPRGEATAVPSFSLAQRGAPHAPEVEANWSAIHGYEVEIWHYPLKPAWSFRMRVPMSAVRSGTQLAGRQTSAGSSRDGVIGRTSPGLRHYVAVTRDGDQALIGQIRSLGIAPPVGNVSAERFGDEVVLSWDWPGPEYEVLARWTGPDGDGERVVAVSQYRTEGGCRIRMGRSGGRVDIFTIAGDAEERWLSPPVPVAVHGAALTVEYSVEFHRKVFGPPRKATLRFAHPPTTPPFEVVVVGASSRYMPFDAGHGDVLLRSRIDPSGPAELPVVLPAIRGTFWLRAFSATAGVQLADPAANTLKVG